MKKSILVIIFLLFSSCLSKQERFMKNREKAKETINELSRKYDLRTSTDTIISFTDTLERERIITMIDTFYTQISKVDTVFTNKEGTYSFNDMMNTIQGLVTVKQDGVLVKVTKMPERIIIKDTVLVKDTMIVERVVTKSIEVINTKPNLFYNIWDTIKNYIWLILIVLCLIIVVRLLK